LNPGGEEIFCTFSRPALGPTQPAVQLVPGLYPGGKAVCAYHYHPPPSSTKVKERAELYLYSTSGPLQPVLELYLYLYAFSVSGFFL